jgi:hypothetical protein
MYVEVNDGRLAGEAVVLRDEDDLTRFSVRVPEGLSPDLLATSLAGSGAGQVDGDEVAVNVDWLRRQTASRPAQWQGDFERMLDYAASKGWLDAARTAVTAHVETL